MTRTDYCHMTGHDKKRALKELNTLSKRDTDALWSRKTGGLCEENDLMHIAYVPN